MLRVGISFIGGLLVLIILASSSCTYINPGNVGVVIHRNGGANGGVDREVLANGVHFKSPMEKIVEYPVSMRTVTYSQNTNEGKALDQSIKVNTADAQEVDFDVSLSYTLDPGKVPTLYQTFRVPVDEIDYNFLYNTTRGVMSSVVGQDSVSTLLGRDKARLMKQVTDSLNGRLLKYGFVVQQFTLNHTRPPVSYMQAIEKKNVAIQNAQTAQNQLAVTQAEANSAVAKAEGEARANKALQMSITPEYIEYLKVQKWDGHLPTVTGSGGTFMTMPSAAR